MKSLGESKGGEKSEKKVVTTLIIRELLLEACPLLYELELEVKRLLDTILKTL